MSGIALVSNPYSRQNRKHPKRLKKLKAMLPNDTLARFPTTFDEMDQAMKVFKKVDIDILAINGGDGTVHIALTHLIQIYGKSPLPKIAILKGGTMNQTATNLRIRGNSVSILKRVLKAYKQKEIEAKQIPLLKIENKYGFIFGNGAVCSFMDAYHHTGNPSPWVAFKTVARAVGSIIVRGKPYKKLFAPIKLEIIADGFSFGYKPYLAAIISTIPELGLGFELMHRSKEGLPHLLAPHDKAGLVSRLFRFWTGRALSPAEFDDTVSSTFLIKSKGKFKYTIDGDFYGTRGSLLIEKGPTLDIITE